MLSFPRFIRKNINEIPYLLKVYHSRIVIEYWNFQVPNKFLRMSRDFVPRKAGISLVLDIFIIFPLSAITKKLSPRKA